MAMKQEKELNELFKMVVGRLWQHQSLETMEEQDMVLVGYLKLLEKLCKMGVVLKEDVDLQGKLFSEFLFQVKKDGQISENWQVKCQTVSTRELVFKLILELLAK